MSIFMEKRQLDTNRNYYVNRYLRIVISSLAVLGMIFKQKLDKKNKAKKEAKVQ